MRLNAIRGAQGAKKARKRVGRGTGSGLGRSGGRGDKGQRARSGGYHKVGFEGGQMPLQRRLPKFGFRSRIARRTAEVRLNELAKVGSETIDLAALKRAGLVPHSAKRVKVIVRGTLDKPVALRGIRVTKGARAAIEAAGGKIEESNGK
ncbi:MAG: 50S ribosomal protein L15 [Gammaproteobacteria bacterium]|nr:50S ribosomal protein L15 [Gammaproteobacteria bacterium]MCI0590912.1 50S ribosomal protein L15 [Gammaproteobacteria bacterium]